MTTGSLFWTVLLAASGGFVVFAGLLMEVLAEKAIYKDIRQFRRSKRVRICGEWLVIIGVFAEVILAGCSAISEWKNDPLKKALSFASARARIIVKTRSNATPLFVKPEQLPLGWRAGVSFFSPESSNAVLQLESENCSMWRMGTTNETECRMEFHENAFNFLEDELERSKTTVKQFTSVDSFMLRLPEMETNAEVMAGTVVLNVNDFTWVFDVPRQVSKWGVVTMQKRKDATGHIVAKVWRVQMMDFVFPPRFTNVWYDGK